MSDQLREALREALATYRCREHLDEDGDGVPLVDVLTHGGDVGPGKRELESLADHLYDELPDAALAQPVQVEPVAPNIGDYVLATKYSDGDPGDAWALGFYDGELDMGSDRQAIKVAPRYMVKDGAGNNIRGNGFRRVARIRKDVGRWLLEVASKQLEASPPGVMNLWDMLTPAAFDLEQDNDSAAAAPSRAAQVETSPDFERASMRRLTGLWRFGRDVLPVAKVDFSGWLAQLDGLIDGKTQSPGEPQGWRQRIVHAVFGPELRPGDPGDPSTPAPEDPTTLQLAAKAVLNHWDEFGPEHGLDETMDGLRRALRLAPDAPRADAITAKPLNWEQHGTEWSDDRGFYITFDAEEEEPYCAAWGEGDPERFATLEAAQQWCHDELTSWLRSCAVVAAPQIPAQAGQWVPREPTAYMEMAGKDELPQELTSRSQLARKVFVAMCAAALPHAATPFPAELSSDMLPRDGGPRFRPQDGGKWIGDEDFVFDAKLRIDGDWGSDEQRAKYAQAVADALNGAPPQAAPEPAGLLSRLRECLPRVGESENVWCSVQGIDLREAVALLERAAVQAITQLRTLDAILNHPPGSAHRIARQALDAQPVATEATPETKGGA